MKETQRKQGKVKVARPFQSMRTTPERNSCLRTQRARIRPSCACREALPKVIKAKSFRSVGIVGTLWPNDTTCPIVRGHCLCPIAQGLKDLVDGHCTQGLCASPALDVSEWSRGRNFCQGVGSNVAFHGETFWRQRKPFPLH